VQNITQKKNKSFSSNLKTSQSKQAGKLQKIKLDLLGNIR